MRRRTTLALAMPVVLCASGRLTAWTGLCLTVLLAGCSTVYSMAISGDLDRPTASFRQAGKPIDLCLRSLEVRDRSDGAGAGRLVWEIQAEDRCVTMDSLAYGEAPTGFTTVHAAEPLKEGVVYEAFGLGGTMGLFAASAAGGATFIYHDGRGWQPAGAVQ